MTKEEKDAMRNPEHKPFMDLPASVQALMRANTNKLVRLRKNGNWTPCLGYTYFGAGCIFAVDETIQIEKSYDVYVVFCGSDGIYKVSMPFGARGDKSVRYLTTVACMRSFAGIRYRDSDIWRGVVDTVEYGVPLQVRFLSK